MAPETRSSDAPVTRSTVTQRRFDSLSAMDMFRQLSFASLLCAASIIVKHCAPTLTAIAALQGSLTPPTFALTSYASTPQDLQDHSLFSYTARFAPISSHLCFQELATAAPSRSDSMYNAASSSTGPSTIFAPSDESLRTCYSCSVTNIHEHIVPGHFTMSYLHKLAFGIKIENLSPGRCITVTTDSLNSIPSSVSPLSPFSCDVEMSSPTYPYHLDNCSGDQHSQSSSLQPTIIRMIKDSILRLRNGGFSNHFSSEALVEALPPDQNSLLIRHYGLYVAPIPLLAQSLLFLPYGAKIPRMFDNNYLAVSTPPSDRKISINNVMTRPHQNPARGATNETVSSIKSLEEAGEYSVIAYFLGMQISIDETLMTIFSLADNVLVSHLENFSRHPSFFRRHIVPCKLLWNDLEKLPAGTTLTTLDRDQTLLKNSSLHKMAAQYFGPFEVVTHVGRVIYELQLPDGSRIHPVCHASSLKLSLRPGSSASSALPLVDDDGHFLLTPVAVMDRRMVKRGLLPIAQVLVQGPHTTPEDTTWEALSVLRDQFPNCLFAVPIPYSVLEDKDILRGEYCYVANAFCYAVEVYAVESVSILLLSVTKHARSRVL